MSSKIRVINGVQELDESSLQQIDWSHYMLYRPAYPESFFNRIYEYHSRLSSLSTTWQTAHGVGAGTGIVSSHLTSKFDRVIVSDPGAGYTQTAQQFLVEKSGLPESKFVFLQEGAEKSSVETGTVDLITACECIFWTDTTKAVGEFARQLKPGGTLAMTIYTRPLILGNERAQALWDALYAAWAKNFRGKLQNRAIQIFNVGLDSVVLPAAQWEDVQRVYINASRDIESFRLDNRVRDSGVTENEERVWVYGDADWSYKKGIDWMKGFYSSWGHPVPKSSVQSLWDELERAIATNGGTVQCEVPVAMVLATRRAH
ncbi:S-adenosyl-L-methionine-dependent methyltransferase [Nemania sp. FL0916]|nr:S-adenosyl-L-methionine-dependent methyltransferase [Nemania sp. FL0916]